MTDTPLTTRDLGEAESALRALLEKMLTGTGLEYGHWVVLQVVAKSPVAATPQAVATRIANSIKVDQGTAQAFVDQLGSRQILQLDDVCKFTSEGKALYDQLSAKIEHVTTQAFAGLDPSDLIIAHRVVASIAARATELLS